jgi:hypothetical protein
MMSAHSLKLQKVRKRGKKTRKGSRAPKEEVTARTHGCWRRKYATKVVEIRAKRGRERGRRYGSAREREQA